MVGSELVRIWFSIGSKMCQCWFRFGSELVQVWIILGLYPVQNCSELAQLDSKTSFRSELVQVWHSWAHLHVRLGSTLVQNWFKSGSNLVQIWFRIGSELVQIWFTFGSALVQFWIIFGSDPGQNWSELARLDSKTSFGSDLFQVWRGWAHLCVRFGSELVQNWFRFGSELVQFWIILGSYPVQNCSESARLDSKTSSRSDLVQVWRGWAQLHARFGLTFVQHWFSHGSVLVHIWFRVGSELV